MSSIIFMISSFLMMVLSNKDCLLKCLLSLEGLMISLLLMMTLGLSMGAISYSGLLSFSYVVVAEGAMGLSLLVLMVRGIGKDIFFFHSLV